MGKGCLVAACGFPAEGKRIDGISPTHYTHYTHTSSTGPRAKPNPEQREATILGTERIETWSRHSCLPGRQESCPTMNQSYPPSPGVETGLTEPAAPAEVADAEARLPPPAHEFEPTALLAGIGVSYRNHSTSPSTNSKKTQNPARLTAIHRESRAVGLAASATGIASTGTRMASRAISAVTSAVRARTAR